MVVILVILLIVVVIFTMVMYGNQQKQKEERIQTIEENIRKFPELKFVKKFEGSQKSFVLCIDEANKKIVYFDNLKTSAIPFKEIIGVEILEDGTLISKKSATRTIGGALVGGALAGGVGSIVGGLSGSSTQKNKVSKIVVKILLRNLNKPSLELECLNSPNLNLDTTSFTYKTLRQNADNIKDVISVIIDMNDNEELYNNKSQQSIQDDEKVLDDFNNKLTQLKSEGKLKEAVNLCISEKKMSVAEANDYVINI